VRAQPVNYCLAAAAQASALNDIYSSERMLDDSFGPVIRVTALSGPQNETRAFESAPTAWKYSFNPTVPAR